MYKRQALSYLLLFWDELSKNTLKNIAAAVRSQQPDCKLKKKQDDGKVAAKKAKDAGTVAVHGNLFGAAADELLARMSGLPADRDSEVACELCGEEFVHPVTYHMRQVHPGCGRPAGGHGYNSGGNFCGGWAGSCGDGGVGGSTWYLMCEACRAKYLHDKKKGSCRKDRIKKPSLALPCRKSLSVAVEAQWMMYHNAVFLLELAGGTMKSEWDSPTVSDDDIFPTAPFNYLQIHGASGDDSVFDDVACYQQHTAGSVGGLDRSVSDSSRHAQYHDIDGVFQRSVSEMADIASTRQQSDSGLHPSTDMTRLIQSLQAVDNITDYINDVDVVTFVNEHHELDTLRRLIVQSIRRAACRTFALTALNWLIRSISQTSCLHDLLWHFVSGLSSVSADGSDSSDAADDGDHDIPVCIHPLTDVSIAGHVTTRPLVTSLHAFLQSVSDVLMSLPAGSAVQRMAVRCWSMIFHATDHAFLHRSHVFSHISSILSSADEATARDITDVTDKPQSTAVIEHLTDVTHLADIKTSSRQAMVAGMTDGSTETFWESGDEDKNRNKTVMISCPSDCQLRVICVHIDNTRDIGNKVSSLVIACGLTVDNVNPVRQVELDHRHVGWVSAWLANSSARFVRVELHGPDNSVRVRQLKLLAECSVDKLHVNDDMIEQRECEIETLSVFRLLTSLVFGRLVSVDDGADRDLVAADDVDLKEHMVGILFSHTGELTRLQRQVCSHIVRSIQQETGRVKSMMSVSDAYCFELLSLLLALSGSAVGRRYVAQQQGLIEDLITLLHTASARVQRQVVLLLRRTLLDITPSSFASLLGITTSPPTDLAVLMSCTEVYDGYKPAVLDVFLACIAKALAVQVKTRLPGVVSKSTSVNVSSAHCGDLWYLQGSVPAQLAESIMKLLMDMSAGRLGAQWAAVTKCAVAGPIINLSHLSASCRTADVCLQSTVIWLALASLCVLTQEHVDQLSTGRWSNVASSSAVGSPTCDNHDDGETPATILCTSGCGSLCTECDRVLHLSRRSRLHHRQVSHYLSFHYYYY